MTTLPQITAAPRAARVNGRECLVAPLTCGALGELVAFAADRFIAIAKRNLARLPVETRRAALDSVNEQAARMTPGSPEFQAVLESPDGIVRLVWLHLRARQPEMTFDNVAELLADPDVAAELFGAIERAEQTEREANPGSPPSRNEPHDCATVFRALAERYGWTPDQVSAMTPVQISVFLAGAQGTGATGIDKRTGCRTVRVDAPKDLALAMAKLKGAKYA